MCNELYSALYSFRILLALLPFQFDKRITKISITHIEMLAIDQMKYSHDIAARPAHVEAVVFSLNFSEMILNSIK